MRQREILQKSESERYTFGGYVNHKSWEGNKQVFDILKEWGYEQQCDQMLQNFETLKQKN